MDAQLVREVLVISSLVQVRDDWVRMGGWEQFVLPDAPRSTVEPLDESTDASGQLTEHDLEGDAEGDAEEEEEEEEDVVFVLQR